MPKREEMTPDEFQINNLKASIGDALMVADAVIEAIGEQEMLLCLCDDGRCHCAVTREAIETLRTTAKGIHDRALERIKAIEHQQEAEKG